MLSGKQVSSRVLCAQVIRGAVDWEVVVRSRLRYNCASFRSRGQGHSSVRSLQVIQYRLSGRYRAVRGQKDR